jgi:hypothetical protein
MTSSAPAQVPDDTPLLTAEERGLLLEQLFDALLRHRVRPTELMEGTA